MKENIKILLLEDSYPDAESIRIILNEAGLKYEIKTVCFKKDFESSVQEEDYDIVLSDHRLPDYDGISALKFLRDVKPQLPFIFVSGALTENDAVDAIRYGANDYVFKHNLNKLLPALTRVLHEREIENEIELHRNHLEELVKQRTEELAIANKKLKDKIEREKKIEILLQNSLRKEKELSDMKTRFISTTSHEFRTPLTTIQSSLQMIQKYGKKWTEEQLDEQFARAKYSVSLLTEMLDDILTISHADSGKIVLNPMVTDLNKFCLKLFDEVKSHSRDNHSFNYVYSSVQKNISIDPKLARLIIINVLANAVKYSPDGGKILMEVSADDKNIIVTISDQGIGIPASEIEYIYEPFYRAGNAHDIEGTGLGLAIADRSVKIYNGKISCHSKPGKGTQFEIRLPVVEGSASS